jgi:putative hydrolase of the HAD superfamily
VALDAVIFDWGGTLTPWHTIDGAQLWSAVCEPHFPAPEAAVLAAALYAAESQLWRAALDSQRSATMAAVFELAGVVASAELIASYLSAWEPHTFTDLDVPELLRHLRGRGIKVGVLSNTMWPREWHENVFRRDGVLDLIDQQRDRLDQAAPGGVPGGHGGGRCVGPGPLRVRWRPAFR